MSNIKTLLQVAVECNCDCKLSPEQAKQLLEMQEQIDKLKSHLVMVCSEHAYLTDRHNELVKDPCKFVDAETSFNAMKLIKELTE